MSQDVADKLVGFTPGPWAVNPFRAQVDCSTFGKNGQLLPVCQLLWPTEERTEARTEANAHLIAAAPDLFEQVELLVRLIEYNIRVAQKKGDDEGARLQAFTLDAACAALAKARGEA